MSKLKNEEIDYIVDTYKEAKSIAKTIEITGFSTNTVNKYVRDMSSKDIRSRYCPNKVYQIDLKTRKIIQEWTKPNHAATELGINLAEIVRTLKGELKQAGGFAWKHAKK